MRAWERVGALLLVFGGRGKGGWWPVTNRWRSDACHRHRMASDSCNNMIDNIDLAWGNANSDVVMKKVI
jgi:hypothetical protein